MARPLRVRIPSWYVAPRDRTSFYFKPGTFADFVGSRRTKGWPAGTHEIKLQLTAPVTLYHGFNDAVAG